MALGTLRREEQVGLVLAVTLHGMLLAAFLLRPAMAPPPVQQRISVTLSQDAGLVAAAPTHEDAAADIAPSLGAPTPPAVSAAAAPAPAASPPPAKVMMPPVARPVSAPKPVALTQPKPQAVQPPLPEVAKPQPHKPASPRHPVAAAEATRASAAPAAKAASKPVPSVKDWTLGTPAASDRQPAGGSRIGNDFLKGVSGGKPSGKAQQQGAAVMGPEAKSALSGAIAHQLKPHWMAPQGADADQLVTFLSWDLNRDGSLAGPPHVVRQEGITDSNRPQAARHAEQAIRAVTLAAPFKLPAEYYDLWKHVVSSRFDRTLSQ